MTNLEPFVKLKWPSVKACAIFKTCLSLLPTSLKVKPLFKLKTGLNIFKNTVKTKIKVLPIFVLTLSLSLG